ncbi:MAG: tetratricopeptide repeat protein [Pseudomonadales bacterium]|nr:tetratricopeptide repeat protein [Pseudomonadales bacterium]
MVRFRPSIIGVLGCILAAGTPFVYGASSSAIVVESRSNDDAWRATDSRQQPTELPFRPPVEEQPSGTGGGEAQYQIQLLQQEVQELRGQVEKLEHEMSTMRATQEDRYLELDSRFQNLMQQLEGRSAPAMDLDLDEESGGPTSRPGSATGGASSEEQRMYESALEMIRNREYDGAIAQLKKTIEQHPNGQYTANAYYWLGEVYAAKPEPEYENARQALAQVITYFPEHRKVPDAAFKLGKVYHLMGDCKRAADILNQIIDQQRGRSVAKLAESYLRDKVGDCN